MKQALGIAAILFFVTMVFFVCYSCVLVVFTGFMIPQLPWGHEAAWTWYMEEFPISSRATFGWLLYGFIGDLEFVEGAPVNLPVTSHFGYAADYFSYSVFHTGVDFSCVAGTPVGNVMSGQVTYAGWSDAGYGNLVVVENNGVQMFYGHLSGISVDVGDVIDAGTLVGLSGNTGRSTGPHLHWEVRVDGVPVDPLAGTYWGVED